jgi:hypothetical protein
MDPVLTLILLLAIITALLYFYFWIRSIARKVDRRGLDVRLEGLEESVRETTRWLETASGQIREDLENRMNTLKNLIDQAENTNTQARPTADQSQPLAAENPPDTNQLEPTIEPLPALADEAIGPDLDPPEPPPIQQDEPFDLSPIAPTPVPEPGIDILLDQDPAAQSEPEPPPPEPEPVPEPVEEPVPAIPGPADRRAQILDLADQGMDISDIARQLDTSRAEVELIVSFRRPR